MMHLPDGWRWRGGRNLRVSSLTLGQMLALTIGALLLVAITVLAAGGISLLREQAQEQALGQVSLAGIAARDEIRRRGEDALTSARVLASRPTLVRLVRTAQLRQLEPFLRRFCETGEFDACGVLSSGTLLAAVGKFPWDDLAEPVAEQGERFLCAPPSMPGGLLGAVADVPQMHGVRVVVLRHFDAAFVAALAERAGAEIRLLQWSDWLETVDAEARELHSAGVTERQTVAGLLADQSAYVSSTPVEAVTGEGVALIEARLPAATVKAAVDRLVTRLTYTALVLGAAGLLLAFLMARRIGGPLKSLTESAVRLGQGDFSTSIPVYGSPEVAALGSTMDAMRRDLIELTTSLRQREAEARAMLQGVVEGVFAVDEERRVRYMNEQAGRMLGLDPADAVGRFCGEVLRPCGAEGARSCAETCPIVAARDSGKAHATEVLEGNTGSRRVVVVTSAAAVDGMQVQVMRDETELEAVRRARDSILANISHEFRTPLAAQQVSIELLRDGLRGLPRDQLEELVASLQRGTLRLTRLIDNLLESIRIESGQLAIRRQPVDLAEVVQGARELIEGLIVQRRQTLAIGIPEELPVVRGDAQRLTQVVTNLLANANKFGPEGSTIRIGAAAASGEVSMWVEDEGPGVPDLNGGSIFERFYRSVDQEPEPRGLGLGLWIVKSIVERHGGRVAVCRAAGGGTRFTIVLPAGGHDR